MSKQLEKAGLPFEPRNALYEAASDFLAAQHVTEAGVVDVAQALRRQAEHQAAGLRVLEGIAAEIKVVAGEIKVVAAELRRANEYRAAEARTQAEQLWLLLLAGLEENLDYGKNRYGALLSKASRGYGTARSLAGPRGVHAEEFADVAMQSLPEFGLEKMGFTRDDFLTAHQALQFLAPKSKGMGAWQPPTTP
jgi:hypothetical protein